MLTDKQKKIIREMVKTDFECGHPYDPWDSSFVRVLKDDDDLKDNVPEAQKYYSECIELGPAGFYEENSNMDWDSDFVSEYDN